jgi:hypothetical protein
MYSGSAPRSPLMLPPGAVASPVTRAARSIIDQSALIPALRITFPPFFEIGLVVSGKVRRRARRRLGAVCGKALLDVGMRSTLLISELRRVTTSDGNPAGPNTPHHWVASNPVARLRRSSVCSA